MYFNNTDKKKFLIDCTLCFFLVVTAAFYFLTFEYSFEKYNYFYFVPYQIILRDNSSLFILPAYIWAILIFYFGIFYIFRLEKDLKKLMRYTLLCGAYVFIFALLLTLQVDTQFGIYKWNYPYKSFYSHATVIFYFFIFYFFIFSCWLKRARPLGRLTKVIFFIPTLPFVFNYFPLTHFWLIIFSFLISYFYWNSEIEIKNPILFLKTHRNNIFLITILILSVGFRLWSLQITISKNSVLMITDAAGYYSNSIDFFNGDPVRNPSTVPAYSFLLFIFYKLVGFKIENVQGLIAIICSSIPLIVFFISRSVFNLKTGMIAAICATFSEHLIHYSSVAHRGGLAAFFLALSVLFLIKLIKKHNYLRAFSLGFFSGWTILLDGVLAPLAILGVMPLYRHRRTKSVSKTLFFIFFGILIAQTPFNYAMYDNNKSIYPLGRALSILDSQWNYGNHSEGEVLREMGFDPFKDISRSIGAIWNNPRKAGDLLIRKTIKEMQNYFLDRQSFSFDPIFPIVQSYFWSSLRFYYFPVLLFGFILFSASKNSNWSIKLALLLPILYPFLFHSLFSMGTNRYRIVTQPLILILFAHGVYSLYFKFYGKGGFWGGPISNPIKLKINFFNDYSFFHLMSKMGLGLIVSSISFLTIFYFHLKYVVHPDYPFLYRSQIMKVPYGFGPWMTLKGDINPNLSTGILLNDNKGVPGLHRLIQDLRMELFISKKDSYDLGFQYKPDFGPYKRLWKLGFYLNDLFLYSIDLPRKSKWIILKNIKLNKGLQVITVKLYLREHKFENDYNHTEKNRIIKSNFDSNNLLGQAYTLKEISLKSFRMVKSYK